MEDAVTRIHQQKQGRLEFSIVVQTTVHAGPNRKAAREASETPPTNSYTGGWRSVQRTIQFQESALVDTLRKVVEVVNKERRRSHYLL